MKLKAIALASVLVLAFGTLSAYAAEPPDERDRPNLEELDVATIQSHLSETFSEKLDKAVENGYITAEEKADLITQIEALINSNLSDPLNEEMMKDFHEAIKSLMEENFPNSPMMRPKGPNVKEQKQRPNIDDIDAETLASNILGHITDQLEKSVENGTITIEEKSVLLEEINELINTTLVDPLSKETMTIFREGMKEILGDTVPAKGPREGGKPKHRNF